MNTRVIAVLLVLGIAALGYFAWSHNQEKPPAQAQQSAPSGDAGGMPPGMPGGDGQAAMPEVQVSPGVTWDTPKGWTTEGPRSMRLATYDIPAASGDAQGASCAVYYFGPGQGGGVDANIARWMGEFQNPGAQQRKDETVNGMKVSRVHAQGTYVSHGGSNMEPQGSKSDYALLGAIVEGPNGAVFFKLTGPAKTVNGVQKDFDGMLKTLRKG